MTTNREREMKAPSLALVRSAMVTYNDWSCMQWLRTGREI